VAALQLDIDGCPGIAHFLSPGDKSVVDADNDDHQQDDNPKGDPESD
jgi:hypothetical protein